MKFLKCLFISLLSVGMVSSAFAQLNQDCIPGVYAGDMRFDWAWFDSSVPKHPFELEVSHSSDEVIFLVTRMDGEREQFCSSYIHPRTTFYFGDDYTVGVNKFAPESRGSIGDTSTIKDWVNFVFDSTSLCEQVNFFTDRSFFANRFSGYKTSKTPRSFNELKRICDSLPAQ